MRKRTRIAAISKEASRRQLAAALARYAGRITVLSPRSPGGSSKGRPPKPRPDRRWREG
jgi:hypothetical protein